MSRPIQSERPEENTGPGVLKRLASMLGYASRVVELEHERMVAAEARLADVNKLLWDWVAGDYHEDVAVPEFHGDHPDAPVAYAKGVNDANHARIRELAIVTGEDVRPENVQHMMQQRASAQAYEEDQMCVCGHGRNLHSFGGPCIGHHRHKPCDEFSPKALALP